MQLPTTLSICFYSFASTSFPTITLLIGFQLWYENDIIKGKKNWENNKKLALMVMKFIPVSGEYFKKLDITSNISQDIKTNI